MRILKVKPWQAFLFAFVSCILLNFTVEDDTLATGILYVVGATLYFGWFAVLGNSLADMLPAGTDYSRNWFLLDLFIVLLALGALTLLTEDGSYHARGLAALPSLYVVFAFVHVLWFPAAALVAIEKNRKPEFGFYFGTMLLLLVWPIGVWFVQPRLNRLVATRTVV
jgi:hypothetical protein